MQKLAISLMSIAAAALVVAPFFNMAAEAATTLTGVMG